MPEGQWPSYEVYMQWNLLGPAIWEVLLLKIKQAHWALVSLGGSKVVMHTNPMRALNLDSKGSPHMGLQVISKMKACGRCKMNQRYTVS